MSACCACSVFSCMSSQADAPAARKKVRGHWPAVAYPRRAQPRRTEEGASLDLLWYGDDADGEDCAHLC